MADALGVGAKWISVIDRLPEPFVSVLVYMPLEYPGETVREGFITKNGIWHAALFDRDADEVTHWMEMPTPPDTKQPSFMKGENND